MGLGAAMPWDVLVTPAMKKQTVMEALDEVADEHGGRIALAAKPPGGGSWNRTTWGDYRAEVRTAARAFIHLGLEPGQGVSIIGFNCPQWMVANLAAIHAGAIPAGIYTTNSPEQCQYIADHSESTIVVVEDADQLAKFDSVRDQLPGVKAYVMMFGEDEAEDVFSWEELLALGAKAEESALEARIGAQAADDVCTLIYTSGTTGTPKGVMLTHDNLTFTAAAVVDTVGRVEQEEQISYLPLSHIAEQVVNIYVPMFSVATVNFAESLEKLGDNLREVRPTMMFAVPRVWEKIQAKMVEAGSKNPWLKKKIAAWARGVGLEAGRAKERGEPLPAGYGLADKLVFSKVKEKLGLDRCRLQITSAAPISRDTLEFFMSLGVIVNEVYGMSESTGPATLSTPDKFKTGSVGWVLPGGEIKIAADGEICMRGRHVFKGYFKNDAATAEALDEDGWLHSGDIGTKDERGFVRITDRKKDLLITAGGENVAPQLIEGMPKGIPAVSQAVVVGDRRPYLAALLTLDDTKLDQILAESGSSAASLAEASSCPKVRAWMMSQVDDKNQKLARVQRIKKISILPADLSIEGGELTPTMKVKRKVVNKKHAGEIEQLYA
jgi:long-subunit acyl-CoA synthetase (AMP-forming)